MLVGRHSSELSGHRLQGELKMSHPPSEADLSRRAVEGSAVPRTTTGVEAVHEDSVRVTGRQPAFKSSDIHLPADWDLATLPNKSFVSRRCSRCSSNLFEHLASLPGAGGGKVHHQAPDFPSLELRRRYRVWRGSGWRCRHDLCRLWLRLHPRATVMTCEARAHRSSGLAVGSSLAPGRKAPLSIRSWSYGRL